ncbi:MAG: tail fiber domain-containing protein [Macellibacteroides fermentans]|uniref:tail fiber domain-containing protein n=1 Tax=Macellibacteroides fermentans TaxID=879969 RepID=UPI003AD26D79
MYGVRSINNDVIDYMTTGGQYFYTMSNNQSPLLTLSSNVGIGTTDPQYKLDVNGSVRTGTIIIDENVSDAGLRINNNSNTYSRIRFFDSAENLGTIHAFTGNQFLFNNQKCINIDSNGAISLGHWNEPNLYINTVNGCVGISNTNPQFKLDVYGASRIYGSLHLNNEGWLNLYNGANTSTISLSHNNASSKLDIYNRTLGNWANVEAGFLTCDTITMKNNLSEKFIRSNAWGGAIRLRANSGAATDRGLQLGRVDNNLAFTSFMAFNGDSGNVSIASTLDNGYKLDVNGSGHYASELYLDYGLRISNAAGSGEGISLFAESSTNPNYGLMFARTIYKGTHGAVNGDWATYFTMSPDAGRGWIFTNSPTTTGGNVASISSSGNLTCSGEITAYSASDSRLKTNIKPITSAIDVINKLNPVQYNWNEKAKELNPLKTDSTEYGLIAQEIEEVLPELVHPIYDGEYKSIDYVKIVPLLIGAIKELQLEINELKNK